jgi:hypothetical protein
MPIDSDNVGCGWMVLQNVGGRIVAVHRMDGARPGNDEIAIAKATTSAMSCRPSAVWEKWIEARTRLMRPLRSLLRRAGWGIFGVHHLPASFTSVHSTQVEPNLTFCLRSANLGLGSATCGLRVMGRSHLVRANCRLDESETGQNYPRQRRPPSDLPNLYVRKAGISRHFDRGPPCTLPQTVRSGDG